MIIKSQQLRRESGASAERECWICLTARWVMPGDGEKGLRGHREPQSPGQEAPGEPLKSETDGESQRPWAVFMRNVVFFRVNGVTFPPLLPFHPHPLPTPPSLPSAHQAARSYRRDGDLGVAGQRHIPLEEEGVSHRRSSL